jgi:hypothetical protein
MKRQPEQLSDATIQPIMFVVMFAYVFGGAIEVPGGSGTPSAQDYREFLMGGIIAQTIVFTAFGVALSIANDRKNQAVDRFRSLPIARGAVLGGHAVANIIKALLPIVLMSVTGYIVGWRIRGDVIDTVSAYGLMIAFSFAMIWVGVLLGSVVATPEGVTGIAFAALFPITFVASTFVPLDSMPGPLKAVATRGPSPTRWPTPGSGSSASWPSAPRLPSGPTNAPSTSRGPASRPSGVPRWRRRRSEIGSCGAPAAPAFRFRRNKSSLRCGAPTASGRWLAGSQTGPTASPATGAPFHRPASWTYCSPVRRRRRGWPAGRR